MNDTAFESKIIRLIDDNDDKQLHCSPFQYLYALGAISDEEKKHGKGKNYFLGTTVQKNLLVIYKIFLSMLVLMVIYFLVE